MDAESRQPETPEQWWARVKREHGPPPARVIARVQAIRQRATSRAPRGAA